MSIPKATIYVQTGFAVSPTEEQLLEFFKDYGLETIDDISEEYDGNWEEIIREWFVNTHYGVDYQNLNQKNNIFRFDEVEQIDEVTTINDDEWEEYERNDLIF